MKRAYAVSAMVETFDVAKNIALQMKENNRLAKETIMFAKVKNVVAVAQHFGKNKNLEEIFVSFSLLTTGC
jgi:hypothetical protein